MDPVTALLEVVLGLIGRFMDNSVGVLNWFMSSGFFFSLSWYLQVDLTWKLASWMTSTLRLMLAALMGALARGVKAVHDVDQLPSGLRSLLASIIVFLEVPGTEHEIEITKFSSELQDGYLRYYVQYRVDGRGDKKHRGMDYYWQLKTVLFGDQLDEEVTAGIVKQGNDLIAAHHMWRSRSFLDSSNYPSSSAMTMLMELLDCRVQQWW